MKNRLWLVLVVLLTVALLTYGVSSAAPTLFTLPWFTVDGGGGRISGGSYTLESVIGQPDAGTLSTGSYTLSGGFLQPAGKVEHKIFLPMVTR